MAQFLEIIPAPARRFRSIVWAKTADV